MSKIVQPFLFFLTGAALVYYGYRVIRDALNNPPDETKYYSSFDAAIASGADPDDEWLYTDDSDMDGNIPF